VRLVPNHLIIRTSFGSTTFPYEEAWTNQLVSKDYVDVIAPMILEASKSNIVGVLNIGTESKSLYEYAQKRNNVKPIQFKEDSNLIVSSDKTPKDVIKLISYTEV
jgi:dTDP-4-dehydrorhamnose reductase